MRINRKDVIKARNPIFIFSCILILALLSSGCEPLRKKFTRKKKAKDLEQDVLPVLAPVDYPKTQDTPEKEYKYYLSLWKVWQDDLLVELQENESQKRQIFLMDQITLQLMELSHLITGDKQNGLTQLIHAYESLQVEIARPKAMRNVFLIQKKLESLGKKVRKEYNFQAIESSLIQ